MGEKTKLLYHRKVISIIIKHLSKLRTVIKICL